MTLSKKAQKILAEKSNDFSAWSNHFKDFLRIYYHGLHEPMEDKERVSKSMIFQMIRSSIAQEEHYGDRINEALWKKGR